MIRQIKTRTKADRFENDVRASKPKWGRYIYLAGVLAFFAYLANLLVGPMIWLQAEGLVTADKFVIASPYETQVIRMAVQPGQVVRKGQLLGVVHSPQVASVLANLASQNAATIARQAELSIKVDIADTVMTTAKARLAEAEDSLRKMNGARALVTGTSYSNAVQEHYAAVEEHAVREVERRTSLAQLEKLQEAQAEAMAAMNDIRSRYNDGNILAPANGVITSAVAQQGDVVRPGEPIAEMFVGEKFVLAYLETGTLYSVHPGERVTVSGGFASSTGTITEILPLTVPLPSEFQKTFRPTARGQVVRISLDTPAAFPHSADIRVTGEKLIPGNDTITTSRIVSAISGAASTLVAWFRPAPTTAKTAQASKPTVVR